MFIFFLAFSALLFGVRTTQVSAAVLGDELHIKKKKEREKKLAIVTVPKRLSCSPQEQLQSPGTDHRGLEITQKVYESKAQDCLFC